MLDEGTSSETVTIVCLNVGHGTEVSFTRAGGNLGQKVALAFPVRIRS